MSPDIRGLRVGEMFGQYDYESDNNMIFFRYSPDALWYGL
jgi:hypothetical protein